MSAVFISGIVVFVLAAFVGLEVISKVPPTLHTPLMSGSNFVHGIVLVGAMVALGHAETTTEQVIGFIAVLLGAGTERDNDYRILGETLFSLDPVEQFKLDSLLHCFLLLPGFRWWQWPIITRDILTRRQYISMTNPAISPQASRQPPARNSLHRSSILFSSLPQRARGQR